MDIPLPVVRQVGQLLCVGFRGVRASRVLLDAVGAGRVGGVILFGRNIESPAQVATLTRELASAAPPDLPLLVAIDQEGGLVRRLRLTAWPRADVLGRGTPELTRRVGQAIAEELVAVGCNVDFAPVLDVLLEPRNPVMVGRTFGSRAEQVAEHGLAFAAGLRAGGVLPCGKHFPGHGRTTADSHVALPEVTATLDELRAVDLVPFARGIAEGLDLLMTAHVRFAALDTEEPATLSRRVMTELLRAEMGFRGVVVTDDLHMRAVADRADLPAACARALAAGCDLLLACDAEERLGEMFDALSRAQEHDPFLQHRIAESAARVAELKRRQMLPLRLPEPETATAVVGCPTHQALAAEAAGQPPRCPSARSASDP